MKKYPWPVLTLGLACLSGCASPPRTGEISSRPARMAELEPSAAANLLVISAVYGSGEKFADVTHRVNDLLREPQAYFWAKPEWLQADPTPGWNKALVIVYELDGRRRIFTAGEGGTVSVARLREGAEATEKAYKKAKPERARGKELAPKKSVEAGVSRPDGAENAQASLVQAKMETAARPKLELKKEPPAGRPFVSVQGEQFLNTGYVLWTEGLRLADVEKAAGGYVGRGGAIVIEVLVFRGGKQIFGGVGPARRVRGETEPVEPQVKPEAPLLEAGDRVVARQVMG